MHEHQSQMLKLYGNPELDGNSELRGDLNFFFIYRIIIKEELEASNQICETGGLNG